MTMFDMYAFADYSGAASRAEQRKRIAWCVGERYWDRDSGISVSAGAAAAGERDGEGAKVADGNEGNGAKFADGKEENGANGASGNEGNGAKAASGNEEKGADSSCGAMGVRSSGGNMGLSVTGYTRAELLEAAQRLLVEATAAGKRVLLGFDHSYSFPAGFYEAAAGEPLPHWRRLLDWLADSLAAEADPASGELRPRLWAARTNAVAARRLGTAEGPFWGPHFAPSRRSFPFAQEAARLPERRVIETRRPGMKSAYQLGGAGSVGLQTLYGMAHLRQLLRFCQGRGIPLHAWPFDGWTPPPEAHVLVEAYPTRYWAELQERGVVSASARRTDQGDATVCVIWAREEDRLGRLAGWFAEPPGLTPAERLRVPLEGWVLGVQ